MNRDLGALKKQIEKWGDGGEVVINTHKHYPSVRSEGVPYHFAVRKGDKR